MKSAAAIASTIVLCALPAAAKDEAAGTASFKSWEVGCDNTSTCTAVGVDQEGLSPFVVVKRDGGPDGTVRVWVGIAEVDPPLNDKVKTLEAITHGGPHPARATLTVVEDPDYEDALTGEIDDPQKALAFTRALKDASSLELKAGARSPGDWSLDPKAQARSLGEVSLQGSSAALRFMDDRQHTAHTDTALVALGLAPKSFTPAAPPLPHVRAAPSVSQDGLPDTLPPALAERPDVKKCGEALPHDVKFPFAARLSNDLYLWGAPCDSGAYNYGFRLFLADRDGRNARLLHFPDFNDELFNPGLDGKTMTLEAFYKGRGLGDCGEEAQWVWDGEAFRPLKRSTLTHCGGTPMTLWPVLYRAVRDPN
jgi:hypothetical protein